MAEGDPVLPHWDSASGGALQIGFILKRKNTDAFHCLVKAAWKLQLESGNLLGLQEWKRRLPLPWIHLFRGSKGPSLPSWQISRLFHTLVGQSSSIYPPRPLGSVHSFFWGHTPATLQQHFILLHLKRLPPKLKVCFCIQNNPSASSGAVTTPWVKAKACSYCGVFACSLWLSKLLLKVLSCHVLQACPDDHNRHGHGDFFASFLNATSLLLTPWSCLSSPKINSYINDILSRDAGRYHPYFCEEWPTTEIWIKERQRHRKLWRIITTIIYMLFTPLPPSFSLGHLWNRGCTIL